MAAAPGTIPSLPQYQPAALPLSGSEAFEVVSNVFNATTAASYFITLPDLVGKAPSVMPVGNPLSGDMVSVYQSASGLYFASSVANLGIPTGNLPSSGNTSQLLVKNSAVDFDASWYNIDLLVSQGTGIIIAGSDTITVQANLTAGPGISIGGSTALAISVSNISTTNLPGPYQTSSFTTNGVVYGNGSAALGATQFGTSGMVLLGQGSAAPPIFSLINLAASTTVSGVLQGANMTAVNLAATGAGGVQGVLSVPNGGTGTSTLTANGVMYGNGASLLGITAAGATAFVFAGQGVVNAPAFETVSTLIDTAIGSTQGNVLYRGSTNWTTLPPGTNGQVLQTLGAGANPKWTSAGAVLLNTMTPNNVASTNDTTSMTATYNRYRVIFDNVVCASSTAPILEMQMATSGSGFVVGTYVSVAQTNVNSVLSTDTSTTAILLSGLRSTTWIGTTTTYGLFGSVEIENPANAVFRKTVLGNVSYLTAGASGTSTFAVGAISGYLDSTSAVTGMNFLFSSGNIQTGTIKVYGII